MVKITAKDYGLEQNNYNFDYLGSRIIDSVVVDSSNNRLAYVRCPNSDRKSFVSSEIKNSGDSDNYIVPVEHIDLFPPTLGYFNYDGAASYMTLLPRRQWKQGITKGQLVVEGHRSLSVRFQFMLEPFYNRYPTITDAANLVCDVYRKVAFHRKLAIDDEFNFYYRGKVVGKVNEDNLTVTLMPDKAYLTEYLTKEGFHVY